ncbi:MAG: CcdC family protein [Bacillaceae bacterium]
MHVEKIAMVVALLMAVGMIVVRTKSSKKPATIKKIILPPFFMSTGALMYIVPEFRLAPSEIVESIVLGMIFSIFLIRTSAFEIKEDQIYLKRSKAFFFAIIGLFIVRTSLKFVLSSSVDLGELSGMFFLVAFAMLVPWRIAMYIQFKKLQGKLFTGNIEGTV